MVENRLNIDYDSWQKSLRLGCETEHVDLEPSKSVEDSQKPRVLDSCPDISFEGHVMEQFEWAEVWRGFRDPQVWMSGFALMFSTIGIYSFSFFLYVLYVIRDTKIRVMNHSSWKLLKDQ